jgi:hypothetical protein
MAPLQAGFDELEIIGLAHLYSAVAHQNLYLI